MIWANDKQMMILRKNTFIQKYTDKHFCGFYKTVNGWIIINSRHVSANGLHRIKNEQQKTHQFGQNMLAVFNVRYFHEVGLCVININVHFHHIFCVTPAVLLRCDLHWHSSSVLQRYLWHWLLQPLDSFSLLQQPGLPWVPLTSTMTLCFLLKTKWFFFRQLKKFANLLIGCKDFDSVSVLVSVSLQVEFTLIVPQISCLTVSKKHSWKKTIPLQRTTGNSTPSSPLPSIGAVSLFPSSMAPVAWLDIWPATMLR